MPSPLATAIRSWRDTLSALQRMPLIFGAAIAALFIVDLAMTMLPPGAKIGHSRGVELKSILQACLDSIALAPLVIGMHRYVLLDDVSNGYAFNFRETRFIRFVRAELTFTAVFLLLLLALGFYTMAISEMPLPVSIGAAFVVIAVIVLALRFLILFPAIAVDAPGARWTNAFADSKKSTGKLFITLVLVVLPVFALTLLYNLLPAAHPLGRIASSLVGCVEQAFVATAMAAAASHFFRAVADRLMRPS
jgi:hypothetical protein